MIQNLANGVEFSHQKEAFMSFLNEFLRSNNWLMQKFFQNVITMASTSTMRSRSTSISLVPQESSDDRFGCLQELFVKHRDDILRFVDDEVTASQLADHLDKVSSYAHMDEFLVMSYFSYLGRKRRLAHRIPRQCL